MRGMTTVEWLVIAAIVLMASRYLIGYWNGIWNPTKEKAEELGESFNQTLGELSASSQLPGLQELPQAGLYAAIHLRKPHQPALC